MLLPSPHSRAQLQEWALSQIPYHNHATVRMAYDTIVYPASILSSPFVVSLASVWR